MADKKIQIKSKTGETWDNLFPKTLASITTMESGKTVEVAIGETNTSLGNKVDKVAGKVLSTNDYTTAEKTKLSGLKDHTSEISSLQTGKSDKATTYTKTEVDSKISESIVDIPIQKTEPTTATLWFEDLS